MQTIILWVMHIFPFLRLRCDEETEIIGVDDGEMGEFAYDYVGIDTELGPRHMTVGGGRHPVNIIHDAKSSAGSEQRSDNGSHHPLNPNFNEYALRALRS